MVDSVSAQQNDNRTNHPNMGKGVGTLAGGGLSAYMWHTGAKTFKEVDSFKLSDEAKAITDNKSAQTIIENSKLSPKSKKQLLGEVKIQEIIFKGNFKDVIKDYPEASKLIKKVKTPSYAFMTVATVLLGLGIGAIVDHFRKKD